ncbi:MAG: hypothetical protein OCD76_02775 [Reichenbachiella sp.]
MESNNIEVAYNGHCAFAVSTGKTEVGGGKQSTIIEGTQYFFSNPVAKLLFRLLPGRIAKADAVWSGK